MASASSLDDYEVSHSEVMTYCLRVGIYVHGVVYIAYIHIQDSRKCALW